jgi:hypothetical protein
LIKALIERVFLFLIPPILPLPPTYSTTGMVRAIRERKGASIVKRHAVWAILAGLLMGWMAGAIEAEQPAYVLLHTTSPPVPCRPRSELEPVVPQRAAVHPYAYGWFGAAPRKHWSRHFGYYRNYTQWSAK